MDAPSSSSQKTSTASSSVQSSPSSKLAPPAPRPVSTPSTDPFLRDFTLVAEAAKRAQIAVMMRDFESVSL